MLAQAVLDAIIRALRQHHGSRWLLDGRKLKAFKRADHDWSENGIDVRFFATVEMAAEWLTSRGVVD